MTLDTRRALRTHIDIRLCRITISCELHRVHLLRAALVRQTLPWPVVLQTLPWPVILFDPSLELCAARDDTCA